MKKQNGNFGIGLSTLVIALLFIFIREQVLGSVVLQSLSPLDNVFKQYDVKGEGGFFGGNHNYKQTGTRVGLEAKLFPIAGKRKGVGLYLAPHASIGNHKVSYYDSNIGSTLLGLGFGVIDIAADGNLDNPNTAFQSNPAVSGDANVKAIGTGLKIGLQNEIFGLTYNLGVDLNTNKVIGENNELALDNGTTKAFDKTIQGSKTAFFAGIGFNF